MFGTKQMRFKNRMESYNSVIRPHGRYLVVVLRDSLTMLVSRIPRGANDVCTTRD